MVQHWPAFAHERRQYPRAAALRGIFGVVATVSVVAGLVSPLYADDTAAVTAWALAAAYPVAMCAILI
jgi:hypothetical protein